MTVETFDEVRVKNHPEIVADAMLEADALGGDVSGLWFCSLDVVCEVVLSVLATVSEERRDYWYSNFVIVGLI